MEKQCIICPTILVDNRRSTCSPECKLTHDRKVRRDYNSKHKTSVKVSNSAWKSKNPNKVKHTNRIWRAIKKVNDCTEQWIKDNPYKYKHYQQQLEQIQSMEVPDEAE